MNYVSGRREMVLSKPVSEANIYAVYNGDGPILSGIKIFAPMGYSVTVIPCRKYFDKKCRRRNHPKSRTCILDHHVGCRQRIASAIKIHTLGCREAISPRPLKPNLIEWPALVCLFLLKSCLLPQKMARSLT